MGCGKLKILDHVKSLEENKYGIKNQILDEPKSLHKNKWGVKRKEDHTICIVLMKKMGCGIKWKSHHLQEFSPKQIWCNQKNIKQMKEYS